MTTLLLCLALQDTRVTLEVREEPLGVAAVLALAPFGDEARWAAPPSALQRVSFRLADAGYLETLDTLGELAGLGPVRRPSHLVLMGSPNECVTFDDPPVLAVQDLTPSARLIVTVALIEPDQEWLELTVVVPPGSPPPSFRGLIGRAYVDGVLSPRREARSGDPFCFATGARLSLEHPGEVFAVDGEIELGDGRRMAVRAGPIGIPARPAPPPPPPKRLQLAAFLVGGLAVCATLILAGAALLRRRPTSA